MTINGAGHQYCVNPPNIVYQSMRVKLYKCANDWLGRCNFASWVQDLGTNPLGGPGDFTVPAGGGFATSQTLPSGIYQVRGYHQITWTTGSGLTETSSYLIYI